MIGVKGVGFDDFFDFGDIYFVVCCCWNVKVVCGFVEN